MLNNVDFTWKIGGEAGFGIMTTGLLFSKIASRMGYHIFDYVEYPSLIRGGHNAYEVRVAGAEVTSLKKHIDLLVCLNHDTYLLHNKRLADSSYIIFDQNEFPIDDAHTKISVPFKKILDDNKGPQVMKNTIALGASLAVLGANLDELNKLIKDEFGSKGEEVVSFNQKFAYLGFDHVKNNYPLDIKKILVNNPQGEKLVLTGNDAFSLGAVIADCRFYAAYPMTPASTVLATLASWQEKTGMIVRHPEDEIAAIMLAIGAASAGVRAATGSSGGGFALKVEAISFAGVAEVPLVIFLAQRPGPATGMPTWTEQGDLLFAVHAGHGDFPKIVLAPGDAQEMIELTAQAFNLADIYQLPVIVLSDMYLSESHKSIGRKSVDEFIASYKIERGRTVTVPSEDKYLRYKVTADGISERLIPRVADYYYQVNSYEHDEDSHSTEDGDVRKKQADKRNAKWQTYLKNDFASPKIYGDINEAEVVFVSWGSTKGSILEARKLIGDKVKTAFIHFTHIYPLNKEKIMPLLTQDKKYILVENNYYGQFGKLLSSEIGITVNEKLLKYDGRPFLPEEIANRLLATLNPKSK